LPEHVKEAFDRLYHQAQRRPREAIPELLEWVERYPDIPQLYNYLSIAYSAAGQREEAEAMIRENYRRNPDYLFARLNYAELCLAKGDYGEIPEIFDHKFDLKLLYPKRKRFHISEAASFMGLVGIYFFEIEERETAENYYDILKEIAPHHPMAKALRRKLFPGLLRRMLIRLTGQS
jgi:tetratricopeptide (TPR) repeat protein